MPRIGAVVRYVEANEEKLIVSIGLQAGNVFRELVIACGELEDTTAFGKAFIPLINKKIRVDFITRIGLAGYEKSLHNEPGSESGRENKSCKNCKYLILGHGERCRSCDIPKGKRYDLWESGEGY